MSAGPPRSDPREKTRVDSVDEPVDWQAVSTLAGAKVPPGTLAGERAPLTIGRYPILRVLGEGAMGTVYAVYDERLDRRVALKLVKGAQSDAARQRMLREAQAMAKLSHPNVVPVFEVGEHHGHLFLAMEYVHGATLDQWRRDEKPGWREILDKYVQAGRGLAAAHAQGLVHRDFKPHNAIVGADGRVRVLDFGLATRRGDQESSVDGPDTGSFSIRGVLDTPLTETGIVMGTPAYMAPEQWMGGSIDHRTDQFSFCVALWEALYGARPFDGRSTDELCARVTRGELTEPAPTTAPPTLRPILERGLKTRPGERWPDVPALLAALESAAVERSRGGRRWLVGSIALATLAFPLGIVEVRDRLRAARARACEQQAAEEVAEVWHDTARARVRTGLLGTGVGHAESSGDRTLPWLDRYARSWQSTLTEVCVASRVHETWSDAELDRAHWCIEERSFGMRALIEELERADAEVADKAVSAAAGLPSLEPCRDIALLSRLPPPPDPSARAAVKDVRERLSRAQARMHTGRYTESLELARETAEQADTLGRPSLHAAAQATVGAVLEKTGHYADAENALAEAYFEAQRVHDYETAAFAADRLTYVVGYDLERHAEGLRWSEHARVALDELGLGDDHPAVANNLLNRGVVLSAAGRITEARAAYERALALRQAALGPDHPDLGPSFNNLAGVYFAAGNYEEAKSFYRRALEISETSLGPDHPNVAQCLQNLAHAHVGTGDAATVRALHERALAIREAGLGPDHPAFASSLSDLANLSLHAGEYEAAIEMYTRALAIREAALGSQHPDVAGTLSNLAAGAFALGDLERAEQLYLRALDIQEAVLPPEHPAIADTLANLGVVDRDSGDFDGARSRFERALAIREAVLGPDHIEVANDLVGMGSAHLDAGDARTAEPMLARALRILEAHAGVPQAEAWARFNLARARLENGGDRASAIEEAARAAKGFRAPGPADAARLAEIEAWLARMGR